MSTRRTFLKTTAITGAGVLVLRSRAWPFDQSPTNITKYAVTLPGLGPGGANNPEGLRGHTGKSPDPRSAELPPRGRVGGAARAGVRRWPSSSPASWFSSSPAAR